MRVLVCGGRDYHDWQSVYEELDALHMRARDGFMVITGAAHGADELAADWADEAGLPHADVRALWEHDGPSAGPRRNQAMLLLQPQLVLAFPGGKGTADMVKRAKDAGIPVKEIK